MGRRKPVSGKARKEQLVAKRQVKRETFVATPHPLDADAHGLPLTSPVVTRGAARTSGFQRFRTPEEAARADKGAQRMKMESRFLKLPLDLLQHHRLVSATEVLGRPIRQELGVLHVEELQPPELEELPRLTCPARPKWRYTQTKEEVEKNEEGMFKKWIATTDGLFNEFAAKMPGGPLRTSPSFFERNLQVWRQLWRVTETASILLILIDVRFPLIHYPPALEAYVKGLKDKKVILVLTKTDLVPRWLSEAWKTWFEEREGPEGASVVLMESYREIDKTDLTQGTQARFTPAAPPQARLSLLDALRKAHHELLQPPPTVAENPERLARWSPRHRREVDWDSVEDEAAVKKADEAAAAAASAVGGGEKKGDDVKKKEKKGRRNKKKDEYIPRKPKPTPGQKVEEEEEPEPEPEPEAEPERPWEELEGDDAYPFISVGLIGQPNVGKSSLLNALLGRKVVRASRTPGKTKTLQTIFWNRTIRLVDCPGLVCPSFAGMERQVLSGIIPIQNVEPVLYFIAQRMPFEKILKLTHPDLDEYSFDDPPGWTADDLLAEYATVQGFITAKAGRPDLYRAGAFILRQLHSSSIPWGFRPPFEGDASEQGQQEGIWIKDFTARASNADALKREREYVGGGESEEDSEDEEEGGRGEESEEGSEGETESEEDKKAVAAVRGAFAALMVEGDDDSDEEESEEDG